MLLPNCDPTRPNARSLRPFGPFFANVISGWTVATDQSTSNAASYKSSDLQVAKASGTATKSFTMAHSMGLVRITLGTKQVNTTYTDYVNNEATDGITNSTKITITASNAFTGSIPYSHTDGKYYFIGQKATKPSFATTSTGVRKWTQASVAPAANLAGNVYVELNPTVAWANNYFYKAYAFSYRAAQQTFTAQANTTYKIECWGAQGADHYHAATSYRAAGTHYGGRGGYVKGYISFTSSRTLYLYTGDQAGYNGGGVITAAESTWGANGGGSTDVRLSAATSSGWSGTASFRSRIIVAAGGGGANNRWSDAGGAAGTWWGEGDGGYGGGLNGGNGQSINHDKGSYFNCYGASQIAGGTIIGYGDYAADPDNVSYYGQFGYAQAGSLHIQSAGGGGWYGGAGKYHSGGSGGSSFMTGYTGCNGMNSSTGAHTNSAYSIIGGYTYAFTGFSGCYHTDSMVLAAGNQTIPTPAGSLTGSGTEKGHTGTGYIIITVCPLED